MNAIVALSDGAWGFLGIATAAFFANVAGIIALFVRSGRTRAEVSQINRAVNHQPEGAPTLVERVGAIEADTAAHREWERKAFSVLAKQVGAIIPAYPDPEP